MSNPSQGAVSENKISTEEQRIRDDLEADIEEDLEREIIDNMCRLARHLQRLYQHRDRRQLRCSATDFQFSPRHAENAALSEMNIRIEIDAATIQLNSRPSADHSDKKSLKTRHSDAIHCRKQHNHPALPWR
ncbi:hypothetical protein GQ55_9G278000 [Panicum hallii var. hallii]|uniref:Uncharacterized protein n=1 Tax=Panicum hallii var. hallii TaxID=1504633 RepID=A0A2T7C7G9_9POAL|nr:hypothetical protein GQ55_9G278000 [Panicum hallii var. hallii]